MKKLLLLPLLVAILAIFSASVASAAPKTTICHLPPDNPTNWNTISVDTTSVADHLAHGDKLGSCAANCSTLCNDGNVCTNDVKSTVKNSCVCDASHPANTVPCNDGNACTTNDTCSNRVCVGGAPPNCNDGNVCTDDSCNPISGCVNTANTASCNDGNACTTNDTCSNKACVGGAPPDCNDNNSCTDDSCNSTSGCVHTNNTAPCDDTTMCNGREVCSNGSCQAGTPLNCNDNNVCTDDSCSPASGCINTAITIDDHNACTTDACNSSTGITHTAVSCNDGNSCTTDGTCNPQTGCPHTNLADNTACSDGALERTRFGTCNAGSCRFTCQNGPWSFTDDRAESCPPPEDECIAQANFGNFQCWTTSQNKQATILSCVTDEHGIHVVRISCACTCPGAPG